MGDSSRPAHEPQISKQRDAFRLTNDLLHDLISGFGVYTSLRIIFDQSPTPIPEDVRTAVKRMSLFHIILTLAKWVEFYDRYRAVIPADVRDIAKDLRNDVQSRGIVRFRNNVVGHIWDDEQGRALTNAEVEERLYGFIDAGFGDFMSWAADADSSAPDRPVHVIEKVRDAIRAAYKLTDADLNL
jgi:hypothetical protein